MSLAIFDLDNTLLAGDSDHLWGEFLIEQGVVDAIEYRTKNDQFYRDYQNGELDIRAFLRFSLKPLSTLTLEKLLAYREQFLTQIIDPIILPAGRDLIDRHRNQGDRLLIITATNRFVTGPIAERLGIEDLLATEPELSADGCYTGEFLGEPCYQTGKVINLQNWLKITQLTMENSWFYSDSYNDLPLLQKVHNPVAVDPDERLREHATVHGWKILSLRT